MVRRRNRYHHFKWRNARNLAIFSCPYLTAKSYYIEPYNQIKCWKGYSSIITNLRREARLKSISSHLSESLKLLLGGQNLHSQSIPIHNDLLFCSSGTEQTALICSVTSHLKMDSTISYSVMPKRCRTEKLHAKQWWDCNENRRVLFCRDTIAMVALQHLIAKIGQNLNFE